MITFIICSVFSTNLLAVGTTEKKLDEKSYQDDKLYQQYKVDDKLTLYYKKPGWFDFVLDIPKTYYSFFDQSFSKEAIPYHAAIALSTALLLYYDQDLVDRSQKLGRDMKIGNDDNTEPKIRFFNHEKLVIRLPTDVGSWMYFIGDGWTDFAILSTFLATGLIRDDNRAIQVASQIAHGLLNVGILVQTFKRSTGHETPGSATVEGGMWRPFPRTKDFNNNMAKYDAFFSGHVAAATLTMTVIAENYPEYNFIYPVGCTLITLLAYQMMNNGVHWASDYPLAIGVGYLFAKVAVKNNRKEFLKEDRKATLWDNINILPVVGRSSASLQLSMKF